MWNTQLTNSLCAIAGNWEGHTLEPANVNCDACLAEMPKPERVKLYTMLLRDRNTGREEEVYGHATENVMTQYGIPNLHSGRFGPGEWELVIRPYNETKEG